MVIVEIILNNHNYSHNQNHDDSDTAVTISKHGQFLNLARYSILPLYFRQCCACVVTHTHTYLLAYIPTDLHKIIYIYTHTPYTHTCINEL